MDLKSMVFGTTFSRDFMRKVDAHSTSILVALKDLNRYAWKQAGNSLKSRMGSEPKWSRIWFFYLKIFYAEDSGEHSDIQTVYCSRLYGM